MSQNTRANREAPDYDGPTRDENQWVFAAGPFEATVQVTWRGLNLELTMNGKRAVSISTIDEGEVGDPCVVTEFGGGDVEENNLRAILDDGTSLPVGEAAPIILRSLVGWAEMRATQR